MTVAVVFVINQLLGCYAVIPMKEGIWSDIGGMMLVMEAQARCLL
tara:strand:+ start:4058 stop:4192 length:135 start_codon:yes stop_codon:yes gene_type:complete